MTLGGLHVDRFMSSTSVTTYTHVCDMCGKTEQAASHRTPFATLYAKVATHASRGGIDTWQRPCDICPSCQDKPISELIRHFRPKE
jgi:hypothetical protein